MAEPSRLEPKPGHKAIRLSADGDAHISGFRCAACGAVFTEATLACRACADRAAPASYVASMTGKLHSWSVVHRSYPGVAVPFISAIVDLDCGLTLKGTLRGCDPRRELPVQLLFDNAGGALDSAGNPYVGFHFAGLENTQ